MRTTWIASCAHVHACWERRVVAYDVAFARNTAVLQPPFYFFFSHDDLRNKLPNTRFELLADVIMLRPSWCCLWTFFLYIVTSGLLRDLNLKKKLSVKILNWSLLICCIFLFLSEFVQMMTAKWKMFSILSLFYIACPNKITLSLENKRSEVCFSEKLRVSNFARHQPKQN